MKIIVLIYLLTFAPFVQAVELESCEGTLSASGALRLKIVPPLDEIKRIIKTAPKFTEAFGARLLPEEEIEFLIDADEINRRLSQLEHEVGGGRLFRIKIYSFPGKSVFSLGKIEPRQFLSDIAEGYWPIFYNETDKHFDDVLVKVYGFEPNNRTRFIVRDQIVYNIANQALILPMVHPVVVQRIQMFARTASLILSATEEESAEVKSLAEDIAKFTESHMRVALAFLATDFKFSTGGISRKNKWSERAAEISGIPAGRFSMKNPHQDYELVAQLGSLGGVFLDLQVRPPSSCPDLPDKFPEQVERLSIEPDQIKEPVQLISKFTALANYRGLQISETALRTIQSQMFPINGRTPKIPTKEELEIHGKLVRGKP